jgi:hypothetical protein
MLLFAVDAESPHDGVRKARRLNLVNNFRTCGRRFGTVTGFALPIVPTGTIWIALSNEILVFFSSVLHGSGCNNDRRCGSLFAEAEFGAVGPRAE